MTVRVGWITYIRGNLLIPFILLFVIIGSFLANFTLHDLGATLIFGLLGYVMMEDYVDFSTALIDIPLDSSGRIKAPENPLEVFQVN